MTAPVEIGPTELAILGVHVDLMDEAAALARIEQFHDRERAAFTSYVNPHTVNLAVADPGFAAILDSADLRTADGFGLRIAGRRLRVPITSILNGTDFNEAVLRRAAARGWGVFLLGGRAGVAEQAATRLCCRIAGLRVVGAHHGFFEAAEHADVMASIRAAHPDLLMVGLGQPQQERWLSQHLEASRAPVGLAVGGFFDFAAGVVPRAPARMNRAGLEWAFRLACEPRRLAGRYLVGIPKFLWQVARSPSPPLRTAPAAALCADRRSERAVDVETTLA